MVKQQDWSPWRECCNHKLIFLITGLAALLGSTVISLSIPEYYHSSKKISVDANKSNILEKGNRFSIIEKKTGLEDPALLTDPSIYVRILRSPSFLGSLANVRLLDKSSKQSVSYEKHLLLSKRPWWHGELNKDNIEEEIAQRVKIELDLHTSVITIRVEDQDPFVAFQMVDTVTSRFQDILYNYQRQRASIDLRNRRQDMRKAGYIYHEKLREYGQLADRNYDSKLPSAKLKIDSLQKDVDLALKTYNNAAEQYIITKMWDEQMHPMFIDLVSNKVTDKPVRPHWIANLLIWLSISWMSTVWFVLLRRRFTKCEKS